MKLKDQLLPSDEQSNFQQLFLFGQLSNPIVWREKCSKEALNYDTRTKFQNGNRGAYLRAYRNGWLDEICSHMKKTKR